MAFPANPSDKMIFEASPDVFFMYDTQARNWRRLPKGIRIPAATPFRNGAMSAEDYLKLQNVRSDPPTTTLTSDQCDLTFSQGFLGVGGGDFVTVRTTTLLGNPATGMAPVELKLKPNKNTAIIDVTIDPQRLALDLIRRNGLKLKGKRGNKGDKGARGRDGRKVPTGPKGPTGGAGASGCGARVAEDILDVEGLDLGGLAVVDIDTVAKQNGSTKLVIYRGAVGDDSLAPHNVNVDCVGTSSWVVALSGQPDDTLESGRAAQTVCVTPGLDTPRGGQRLYFLDIAPILALVRDQYFSELERIRIGQTNIARFWLDTMNQLYTMSKDALCCALYACKKTQTLLAEEAQRAANDAARGDGAPAAFMDGLQRPASDPTPLSEIRLLLTPHDPSASAVLRQGHYKLRYERAALVGAAGVHGEFTLQYRHSGHERAVQIAGHAPFRDADSAWLHYGELVLTVSHDGGAVAATLVPQAPDDAGEVIVALRRLTEQQFGPVTPDDFGILSEACSGGQAAWMVIARTPAQDFVVCKIADAQLLDLLSFGEGLRPPQILALPVLHQEIINCAGSQLGFDDLLRDALLVAFEAGAFEVYSGNPAAVDLARDVMDLGVLCPWV
jgi:hypothetical protein